MMNLSQHFTLAEFTASEIAERKGIGNTPPQQIIAELQRTAGLMEQVRSLLCVPITITSGYRCSALNKLVGSKPTSLHVQGLACDFKAPAFGTPIDICKKVADSDIVFGKLILEFYTPDGRGWVHIQVGTDRKLLTINGQGVYSGLHQ